MKYEVPTYRKEISERQRVIWKTKNKRGNTWLSTPEAKTRNPHRTGINRGKIAVLLQVGGTSRRKREKKVGEGKKASKQEEGAR